MHLIRPIINLITDPWSWTNLWIMIEIQVFAFMSLYIERLIAREVFSPKAGQFCHLINCASSILAPIIQILMAPSMPVPAIFSLIFAIVFFMKLWSYAQANRWYREESIRLIKETLYSRRGTLRRVRSVSVPSVREIEFDEPKERSFFIVLVISDLKIRGSYLLKILNSSKVNLSEQPNNC